MFWGYLWQGLLQLMQFYLHRAREVVTNNNNNDNNNGSKTVSIALKQIRFKPSWLLSDDVMWPKVPAHSLHVVGLSSAEASDFTSGLRSVQCQPTVTRSISNDPAESRRRST